MMDYIQRIPSLFGKVYVSITDMGFNALLQGIPEISDEVDEKLKDGTKGFMRAASYECSLNDPDDKLLFEAESIDLDTYADAYEESCNIKRGREAFDLIMNIIGPGFSLFKEAEDWEVVNRLLKQIYKEELAEQDEVPGQDKGPASDTVSDNTKSDDIPEQNGLSDEECEDYFDFLLNQGHVDISNPTSLPDTALSGTINMNEALKMSTSDIEKYLDARIYGQNEAKHMAAEILHACFLNKKINWMFKGPSGCGKTEIFRRLKKIYPYIYIYDVSSLSSDGFKGRKKAYSVFDEMRACGMTTEQIEHSIIVFDEFDKIVSPMYTSGGDNVHTEVQAELLSIVEGTKIVRNGQSIDTSKISFIFLGAFSELTASKKDNAGNRQIGFGRQNEEDSNSMTITLEDIISYGLMPELAGRIYGMTSLNGFSEDDYRHIIMTDSAGILSNIAEEFGVKSIALNDATINEMASLAAKNGLGIRHMANMIRGKLLSEDLIDSEIDVII